MSSSPVLNLTSVSGGFPFQTKQISMAGKVKVLLGAVEGSATTRKAGSTNGYFAPKSQTSDSPLTLSVNHAEVWLENGRIYIRDLDSPFGTFVNDVRIESNFALKTGDILVLGKFLIRNMNTPADITDDPVEVYCC
ncbi:uncharacterized protein BT62DRAFT_653610 [Guyanagaster necrorhizus]|uniref:FHA domain-containing protein n=1 Tax=Guyanagaster necrorhizus TaxID=856835 RepID=A0A9P8AUW8_9AGAR|nr:uncharacterized protein BT62DRAFT_653610 [Guyanagaster necrorhizus MCA 3950]KAG7448939.1 hypothetical protein BT62DRAFT_653610 [Guyanagaster necrorhizus MCA 3950]